MSPVSAQSNFNMYPPVRSSPEFSLGFKHTDVVSHLEPETSLKSIRTYQMGVVFADQYGIETPVLTNKRSGSIYLDKDFCDQKKYASYDDEFASTRLGDSLQVLCKRNF